MRARASGGAIEVSSSKDERERMRTVPGARWDAVAGVWRLPASPMAAHTLADLGAEIDEELEELARKADPARREDPALNEPLPFESPVGPAWGHQVRASRWLATNAGALLQYGMGTGKTRAALDALRLLGTRTAVVLCPLRVCRVWASQAELHHPGHFEVLPLDEGELPVRRRRLDEVLRRPRVRPLIVAINYESAWRETMGTALAALAPEVLVLDECHRIKTAVARQSRYATQLARRCARRWGLSGTPLAHSPVDAYSIFKALDPGVFGTSKALFTATYCVMGGYGGYEVIGYRNLEDFRRRYFSITLAAGRELLDLPETLTQEIVVDLPPEALAAHEEVRHECATIIEQAGARVAEVVATNVLTRMLRMCQIAAGHVGAERWVEGPNGTQVAETHVVRVHERKLEALADLLEDLDPCEPLVVFARFRHDLAQIAEAAERAGRKCREVSGSANDLEAWQSGSGGEVLACQIQSGGEGIDLTRARYCVYWDLPFSLAQFEQSMARVHRPGQTRPVTYYHLIARGTIDRYVARALARRRDVIDQVLEGDLDFQGV